MSIDSPRRTRFPVRGVAGVLLLAVQVVMIVAARFHPMRYYCWAPYDAQNEYEIHAVVDGRMLTPDEVLERYRLHSPAINPRMIYQVTGIIEQVEETYHPGDPAVVDVVYRTNGGEEQRWHWPPR